MDDGWIVESLCFYNFYFITIGLNILSSQNINYKDQKKSKITSFSLKLRKLYENNFFLCLDCNNNKHRWNN